MKTKKRRMEYISFYNHTGLEKHFTKMAKKGWLIETISNLYWTYRKIEPKDIHFCVTYYPRASDFDPEPSEQQQTFHDFCAYTGWQLACAWHQMQVFYNEKDDPIPLDTDPVLEVEKLHGACRKNFLPSYFFLLALGMIMGFFFVGRMFVDPIGLLSSASNLVTRSCFLLMAVISITELAAYYFWYFRAKKAAAEGIFMDTPSTLWIQKTVFVLLIFIFAGWIVNIAAAEDPLYQWIIILTFAYMFILIVVVNGIKQGLKRAKASRGLNKTLTILACFVLSFLMTGGVVYLTLFMNRSGVFDRNPEDYSRLPLSLADLTEINEDDYIAENRVEQTVLLGQSVVYQRPHFDVEDTSGMPDLRYTVTTVKVPFLYDWCKDQMYSDQDESDDKDIPTGHRRVYVEQDASAWGAKEVYRLYNEEGWYIDLYLLCYEDRIIEIRFDWEPTEDQMAIVGEKFYP